MMIGANISHQLSVIARKPVLQQDERDGAPERAEEMVHAAQHRHQQRVAGVLPAQIVGIGAAQHQASNAPA